MENKQTSVEWLVNQLEEHYVFQDIKNTVVFDQAKAMHRYEIEAAYLQGRFYETNRLDAEKFPVTSEQYYNETFNQ